MIRAPAQHNAPEFQTRSKTHSFPNSDCLLLEDRYPKLQIYYSETKEGHVKLRALYFPNRTRKILTSEKISQLIGLENFSNIYTLCKHVYDTKTRLLLIMGLLTEERFGEPRIPSKTQNVECQTDMRCAWIYRNTVASINPLDRLTIRKPSYQKPKLGCDLKFELEEERTIMQIIKKQNPITKNKAIEKDPFKTMAQSGRNEVVQNEDLSQSGSDEDNLHEELSQSSRNKVVLNEELSQSGSDKDNLHEDHSQSGCNEVVQKEELLQSGSNEVVRKEKLLQSENDEDINNEKLAQLSDGADIINKIRQATKFKKLCELHHGLHKLCKVLKGIYPPDIVTKHLTHILHDALKIHEQSINELETECQSNILVLECFAILVEYGAELILTIKGSTALHIIAEKSTADVADLAIKYINKSAAHLRTKYGVQSISEWIGHSFDDQGYNPLMVAALSCNHEVLEVFLKAFPRLVDVTTDDDSSHSALTLVTIQAIEYQLKNGNFEPYKKVMQVLKKYNAYPGAARLRVKSSYVKDITPLRNFFKKWTVVEYTKNEALQIAITPFGRVIRNYKVDFLNPSVKHPNMNIKNNITLKADFEENQQSTGPKTITKDKFIKVTNAATTRGKKDEPEHVEKSKRVTGSLTVLLKNSELEKKKQKYTKIIDPKLIKNIKNAIKKSDEPKKTAPVLVKMNKNEILGTKLKLVATGDLKIGQYMIPNNELSNIKDLLAKKSTKNMQSECSPTIVKVESNAEYFHSNATPSTSKMNTNSNFVTTARESDNKTPELVKTEPVDENVNKHVENTKFYQILKSNKESCTTNNITMKRPLESDEISPVITEKKSRNNDLTKSLVSPDSQIVIRNNEDKNGRPITIKEDIISDLFNDTRELEELLEGNIEDKIIFDSSDSESEEDCQVEAKISTEQRNHAALVKKEKL